MKAIWGSVLVGALILGAGILALSCKKSNPAGPGTRADVTINILGIAGANSYSPNPDTVLVGRSVAWHNIGGTTHTATATGTGGFDTGNIVNGATSSPIVMNTVGTFPYICSIHGSSMNATLVVR